MKRICISKNWLFTGPGAAPNTPVDLPYDYTIALPRDPNSPGRNCNAFTSGGCGRFVKYLKDELDASHVILDIDGAYMCAEVYWNENHLGMHPHGYAPWLVDLTEFLLPGQHNKLDIRTNDHMLSTRWYAGAGLYRDVFLWLGGDVRIEPRDLFVTTPEVSAEAAKVHIDTVLTCDRAAKVQLAVQVLRGGETVAEGHTDVAAAAGKTPAALELTLKNPALWDTEHPNLYELVCLVRENGAVADTAEVTFGVRSIFADAKRGFLLNGKPMKMRGGCIHHDHGVLGAAAFPAAEERKLKLLKKAGFNAVRTAHNPPSLALLEVCDRIGMIVMDEAFDMWNECKIPNDYHLWFADWWQRDIDAMVLRDRNHPCVMSYSIGNEILERTGRSHGARWAQKLADEVRRLDSTRFVTSGICHMWTSPEETDPEDYQKSFYMGHPDIGTDDIHSSWEEWTRDFMAPLDIVGYNYLYDRYAKDHEMFPDRVIWGSETKALYFYDSWHAVLDNDHVLGDFTWTAYDNMGEAGMGDGKWTREGAFSRMDEVHYPARNCYQGDLELTGFRRPQSYFREAVWLDSRTPQMFTAHPRHYGDTYVGTTWHWYDVLDSWTFEDEWLGKPVACEVYTDADDVAWYCNGTLIGHSVPEKAIARCTIPYAPGTVKAVCTKNGQDWGTAQLHTVGAAERVQLHPEKNAFAADRRDLLYVDIDICDKNGDRVPDSKAYLSCLVTGGELMGIFSGDPANDDPFTADHCHAFMGRALAVIRTAQPGTVTVTVGGPGLAAASVSVKAE